MSDEELDFIGDMFVENKYREKYGWTFEQFLTMYQLGKVARLHAV